MLSPLRTRSAGPPVAAPPAMREVELAIEGMSCAACAVRIEKKLNKLDHVTAAVNYATATARVTAPPALPVEALTTAIGNAGYAAWPTGSTAATAAAARRRTPLARRQDGHGGQPGTPRTCAAG